MGAFDERGRAAQEDGRAASRQCPSSARRNRDARGYDGCVYRLNRWESLGQRLPVLGRYRYLWQPFPPPLPRAAGREGHEKRASSDGWSESDVCGVGNACGEGPPVRER